MPDAALAHGLHGAAGRIPATSIRRAAARTHPAPAAASSSVPDSEERSYGFAATGVASTGTAPAEAVTTHGRRVFGRPYAVAGALSPAASVDGAASAVE